MDGSVGRAPANFPPRQCNHHFDCANSLAVEPPDISFSLDAVRTQTRPGRVELDFIAFGQLEYEVRFRPSATAPWSGPVPFSLTSDGPFDQTVVVGQADFTRIYLDPAAASGIYAVTLRLKQV